MWTWHQDETHVLGQTHPAERMDVAPHPPISTVAPKHAGYLGSLRNDLWLKRCMQSQESREHADSWKNECNTCNQAWWNFKFNIKTVVTMSIEELLIWAVIWVSCYALHPPLWDAVTWWAHWKTTDEQKIHCYFGTCVSASLFLNTHTHTLQQRNIAQSPPAHSVI